MRGPSCAFARGLWGKERGAGSPAVAQEQGCRWGRLGGCVVEGDISPLSRPPAVSRCSRPQTTGAAALGCRDGWIGYHGICYYISREEASWESSQRHCSSLGASLAVLKREWEVPFLRELKVSTDCWLGLRRQDGRLVWVDGTVYNETFPVHGQGDCAYMNDAIASSSCSQLRPYICSVALAPL
ncbi:C-type lectin domain family 2 member B-like [Apteryx mantelli]|uniref:C-type lectin domain family 2 member B-like n=1 Tax=Apteryx mantelli TaxID=2696672 RepID=A0ABM4FYF2_9AVES